MKKGISILLTALLCLMFLPAMADEMYRVIYPSELESTIAAGRDFVIIASVPADAESATVRVLDDQQNVVRTLTGTNKPQFCLDYAGLNAFNTDQAEYYMPDLVYRPDDPDSLYDGSIKCYLQNGLLIAVVAGGYYAMDGRALVDENGKPYEKLQEGQYTIEITVGGETLKKELSMGVTQDKVMARFSPDGHMRALTETAKQNGFRVYQDPLPGYWSPSSVIPGQEGNKYFAELKERWQLADAMEYYSGEVHFYVYNLTSSCATVSVELAALNLDKAIDTRMIPYYYDIGEPLLGYADTEQGAYLLGQLVPFDTGDKLVLTRAEVMEQAQENDYVAYTGDPRPIDIHVEDGVSVPAGKELVLFGVLAPIQNEEADMKKLTDVAWEVGNRVTRLDYTFTCGETAWTESHEVGLTRVLAEGWNAFSLYEFAHVFTLPDTLADQTVTVRVAGFDAHDQPVAGTEETFRLAVTK